MLYRHVIRITAEDSPNITRERLRQSGQPESSDWPKQTPGVLTWEEYQQRLRLWDEMEQCIGLQAQFYEGKEILLFPPVWLERSARLALNLPAKLRKAKGIGVDPGEGSANTSFAAVDELGLIELLSIKTPDTSVIRKQALAFVREHGVDPSQCCFDRGGGGKQIADDLRADGYPVRTVAFGETLALEPHRGIVLPEERKENREERYTYMNRRAEMYGELSLLLDASREGPGFAIPRSTPATVELHRQLSMMPKLYDREGRLRMLPKNRASPDSKEKTLSELLGCSPDEADATVLAVHAMLHKGRRVVAGGS